MDAQKSQQLHKSSSGERLGFFYQPSVSENLKTDLKDTYRDFLNMYENIIDSRIAHPSSGSGIPFPELHMEGPNLFTGTDLEGASKLLWNYSYERRFDNFACFLDNEFKELIANLKRVATELQKNDKLQEVTYLDCNEIEELCNKSIKRIMFSLGCDDESKALDYFNHLDRKKIDDGLNEKYPENFSISYMLKSDSLIENYGQEKKFMVEKVKLDSINKIGIAIFAEYNNIRRFLWRMENTKKEKEGRVSEEAMEYAYEQLLRYVKRNNPLESTEPLKPQKSQRANASRAFVVIKSEIDEAIIVVNKLLPSSLDEKLNNKFETKISKSIACRNALQPIIEQIFDRRLKAAAIGNDKVRTIFQEYVQYNQEIGEFERTLRTFSENPTISDPNCDDS